MNDAPSVAVVHDWLQSWRGGERVLAEILRAYPTADLFALVDFLPDADRRSLRGKRATTSFLQHFPFAKTAFRYFLPVFPLAIESFDLARYDLVISSSHAVAKGVRTHRKQLHVCYCYSPMRYAWDLREQYLAQTGLDRGLRGIAVRGTLARLRAWDRRASARVDHFIAISRHIADRIRRCYGRDSTVIYPPVAVAPMPFPPARGEHYVTVSQLVPYKRVDIIVEAFARLPERRLVVIGDGPQRARIASAAPPNVTLTGWLPEPERDRWLATAKAFVFAAEEDFGIAPLEAQAFGTPVIAYAKGGSGETVMAPNGDAPAALLFPEQSSAAIVDAIHAFERAPSQITADACRRNARRFEPERFRDELRRFIDARMAAHLDPARSS